MRQVADERANESPTPVRIHGGVLDLAASGWRLVLRDSPHPIALVGPRLTIDGQALDPALFQVRTVEQIAQVTRVSLAHPDKPGLAAVLELESHAGVDAVRLRILLSADRQMHLERSGTAMPFLGVRVAHGSHVDEVRIGDFDPLLHTYRPFLRPLGPVEGLAGDRLAGPMLRVLEDQRQLLFAQEGPVEAEHSFWPFSFESAAGILFAFPEAGAMLARHDLADSGWESEWFVLAADPTDVLAAYRRMIGALGSDVGADDVAYNTWYKQESAHNLTGVPYLAHINPAELEAEMDAAAAAGVTDFTIDVGWFNRSGDWYPHPERLAGGLERWVSAAAARGLRLGLWMNPMVAGVTSAALRENQALVMTRDAEALPSFPVWETEDSVPMCLASAWLQHIQSVVSRLADAGVRKVKLDGVWPATYEWAGKRTVYDCDSPTHFHGDAGHTAEERRARYTYVAVTAVTRLTEWASSRGVTLELDVTESFRYPRLGQMLHGRLFLINNGPYFHDLGVPSTTSIVPNAFNAVFYPHAAHSRIQRSATLFGEILPPGRVFGHVLVHEVADEHDEKVLRNALATAAVSGLAIWGNLSALSPSTLDTIRSTLSEAARARSALDGRGREATRGFVGSSPETYLRVSDTGTAVAAVFAHQPAGARIAIPYPGDARAPRVRGGAAWTRTDGALLVDVELEADDARLILVEPGD